MGREPETTFDPKADGWEMIPAGNFMSSIGPIWRKQTDSELLFGMLTKEVHANHRNIVHGGVLMAFADYAIGMTAVSLTGNPHQVTVQLDVHFVAAAELGQFLIGRGEVIRRGSSVYFLRGVIEAGGKVVATGQGVWKPVKPPIPAAD